MLKKCRNIPKFLPIILAPSFETDTFSILRNKGIIVATYSNLYGEETAKLFDPQKMYELFDKLSTFEGISNQIRGPLFEMICVHLAQNTFSAQFIENSKDFSEIEKQAKEIRENFLIYQKKLKTNDIIKSLKEQNLYPYNEEDLSPSEKVSQPLYDNIIIKINEKKPAVLRNPSTRKFIAATVKVLIEQEPEHFVNILQNLLELTSEETIEFSKLLNETPLPAMIKTTKIVSDRLKLWRFGKNYKRTFSIA